MNAYFCPKCKKALSIFSFSKYQRSIEGKGLCHDCEFAPREVEVTVDAFQNDTAQPQPIVPPRPIRSWGEDTTLSMKDKFKLYQQRTESVEKERKKRSLRNYGELRLGVPIATRSNFSNGKFSANAFSTL